jgi:hypothetical protein
MGAKSGWIEDLILDGIPDAVLLGGAALSALR